MLDAGGFTGVIAVEGVGITGDAEGLITVEAGGINGGAGSTAGGIEAGTGGGGFGALAPHSGTITSIGPGPFFGIATGGSSSENVGVFTCGAGAEGTKGTDSNAGAFAAGGVGVGVAGRTGMTPGAVPAAGTTTPVPGVTLRMYGGSVLELGLGTDVGERAQPTSVTLGCGRGGALAAGFDGWAVAVE